MRARAAAALLLAIAVLPRVALGDSIEACASAVAEGQRLQRTGKVVEARASLLGCVKPACPAEVKAVCDRLLSDADATVPTIILAARSASGQDLVDVRVSVDGAPFATALDGRPREIDPGPHVVRFVRPGGSAIEQSVVVREAEKNRPVVATFPADAAPAAVLAPTPPPPEHAGAGPVPYVLGGVAVLALGGFAYLAVHGQSEYDACEPHACSTSKVSSLEMQRALAFVTLGVGFVALGAATWLYVAPTRERGVALGGRF